MRASRMFVASCLMFLLNLWSYVTSSYKLDVRDMNHMKSHLRGTIDYSNLTQREMLFYYFQVHDIEGNNKLDGCEILQSLLHAHSEATANYGAPVKVFSDAILAKVVDAFLDRNDKNLDGFVDYAEFLSGEMSRGF